MRMVTWVEIMMVQSPVKPVIQKLHRAHMKQNCNNHTICSPKRHVSSPWNCEISYVEYDPIENNLVIPTKPKHHQKTWTKTSHKDWFEALNFLTFCLASNDRMRLYIPVSFSFNLLKFNALVNNPVVAFGCSMARKWNPKLVVEHPP